MSDIMKAFIIEQKMISILNYLTDTEGTVYYIFREKLWLKELKEVLNRAW